jgi:hypothetical protein
MVKLAVNSSQTAFDIAETFAIGQLCESHTQVLVMACKRANPEIPTVPGHTPAELMHGQKVHYLRKYRLAVVHSAPPPV